MTDPTVHDEELEALMAELEAQNAEIAAAGNAPVNSRPANDPVSTADETPAPAEPATQTAPAVEASAASDDEAEIAELEAALAEVQDSAPAPAPAEVPDAASVSEELPAEAVEALTKNGTAIEEPAAPAVTVKVEVDASAAAEAIRKAATEATEQFEAALSNDVPRTSEKAKANQLQHYVDVDQFRSDTRVTETNLDQCMIEQSGLRAYYGAKAANAEAQAARVKAKFEVVEATLYDHHRKALAASGEKTTEKMVENAVKLDPRWLKAKNLVIEAETIATINKSLVESLKDRRDMIIQLGADRRDEYKGAARVLAEQQEREELRDRAQRLGRQALAA